ncbi:MAG: methyltransferase domain-containing protein [Aliishimia sp.]
MTPTSQETIPATSPCPAAHDIVLYLMTEKDDLNRAYALETPDDSRKLYAEWAETYDADFVGLRGYILHDAVASAFVQAKGQGPVLDIGAGTGICGVSLKRHGVSNVDGVDITPQMLAQAALKGAYSDLFPGDILAGLDKPDGSYPGIVSAGTFTCGHVGPDGLDEITRLLAPSGLAIISVRDVHFVSEGFEAKLDNLRHSLAIEARPVTRIYATDSQGENADDLALLLHLRKI